MKTNTKKTLQSNERVCKNNNAKKVVVNDRVVGSYDEDSIYTYLPNGQIDCGFTIEDIFDYMDTGIDKKGIIAKDNSAVIDAFETLIKMLEEEQDEVDFDFE